MEVLEFGWSSQARFLESLGATITVRTGPDGQRFRTDQGNLILDCGFGPINDPSGLATQLEHRAGIVGHGLFLGLASAVVVAGPAGIRWLTRP